MSSSPKVKGNVSQVNSQGQDILDNILIHPSANFISRESNCGSVLDIRVPNHGGVRFSVDGNFIGFLEP